MKKEHFYIRPLKDTDEIIGLVENYLAELSFEGDLKQGGQGVHYSFKNDKRNIEVIVNLMYNGISNIEVIFNNNHEDTDEEDYKMFDELLENLGDIQKFND